jgi:hypothetical protein
LRGKRVFEGKTFGNSGQNLLAFTVHSVCGDGYVHGGGAYSGVAGVFAAHNDFYSKVIYIITMSLYGNRTLGDRIYEITFIDLKLAIYSNKTIFSRILKTINKFFVIIYPDFRIINNKKYPAFF